MNERLIAIRAEQETWQFVLRLIKSGATLDCVKVITEAKVQGLEAEALTIKSLQSSEKES